MTARDDLAHVLSEWLDDEAPLNLRRYVTVADAVVAKGWRPPARTVSTVEELEALPSGAILAIANSSVPSGATTFIATDTVNGRRWYQGGSNYGWPSHNALVFGPFTVLHEAGA